MELLIHKAKQHDKAAFAAIMTQNAQSMYKVAKAILKNDEDVADAMQETALNCWEKIGTLKKNEYFKTWIKNKNFLPVGFARWQKIFIF